MGITDAAGNHLGTFYSGAMREAKDISLASIIHDVGAVDFVIISPNDPQAMLNHTRDCRQLEVPFLADPSQQLATLETDNIKACVEDAAYLVINEYEVELLKKKCKWSEKDILSRVGVLITTLGARGISIKQHNKPELWVDPIPTDKVADPTGAGDSFRAGFVAGLAWQLSEERSAQLGALAATCCIETIGTQEYQLTKSDALTRLARAYGDDVAAEIERMVRFRVSDRENPQPWPE
jgi:adenosine kinase